MQQWVFRRMRLKNPLLHLKRELRCRRSFYEIVLILNDFRVDFMWDLHYNGGSNMRMLGLAKSTWW